MNFCEQKTWPGDARIDYKSHSSLIKLIGIDVDLEEELE